MCPSRSRDHDAEIFEQLAATCIDVFSFLRSDFGYLTSKTASTKSGFEVRFSGDRVGVEVTYQIGDPLSVYVCLLNDGKFPEPTGEILPVTRIDKFDLVDIEIEAGVRPPAPDPSIYAIPTRGVLENYAGRLRAAGAPLLSGDLSMVPVLRARVLDRARSAAHAKWGDRAAEFGW